MDMVERIDRQDDQSLYQPKIHSKRIRELYQLGQQTGLPMTTLVDVALALFLQQTGEKQCPKVREICYNGLCTDQRRDTVNRLIERRQFEAVGQLIIDVVKNADNFMLMWVDTLEDDPDGAGWRVSFVTDDAHVIEGPDLQTTMLRARAIAYGETDPASLPSPSSVPSSRG